MISWDQPYSSRRRPVLAANVVATSQPLAAQAGLQMLHDGGNAVDAALAAAMALTVLEPISCGIGGDLFAIVWDGKKLHGLNASGRSPAAWTPEYFARHKTMPTKGWDAINVPGVVSGWTTLSEKFGQLPLEKICKPAADYAAEGFPVSPGIAFDWANHGIPNKDTPGFADAFLPKGQAPAPGETFSHPAQAETLQAIAESKGEAFYRGEIASKIAAFSKECGGVMTEDDLASHEANWVDTITMDFAGLTLHEIPPNGQGLAALSALGILKNTSIESIEVDTADYLHLQIESMKLAFADTYAHVADPESMVVSCDDLLAPAYLSDRAKQIDLNSASQPVCELTRKGGTVYLTAADSNGMMVSLIHSLYMGFGSGFVVPGTGIALQNRGAGFTLEPGHPNQVGPRKLPFHTIIPAFITRQGQPLVSYGVMGGDMQAQGHLQFLTRLALFNQNPQTALDAPRFKVLNNREICLEKNINPEVVNNLEKRGHKITYSDTAVFYGGGQAIYRLDTGKYVGASDPRRDGQAVGF